MQGDFGRMTVYSNDPVEVAARWHFAGAERIHIVDLDGSRAGAPRNQKTIEAIVRNVPLPIEVGGGIRNIDTVGEYFERGARWVILGTAALKDRKFLEEACRSFQDRIILGIDGRNGKAAIEAWTDDPTESVENIAGSYQDTGISSLIYTDISRDGMESGVNIESTRRLAESIRIPVIASGGVSTLEDIKRLKSIEQCGVIGVIIGKALYSGALRLEDAIKEGKVS
jgi:phosphoribosylformimino-5-aminoimidazole carboxamide ribotide isomerase